MEFYSHKFTEKRKQKRYSVNSFAEAMGITRATLWAWETGKRVPSESSVRKIALILEIDPAEISDLPSTSLISSQSISEPISNILNCLDHNNSDIEKAFNYICTNAKHMAESLSNSNFILKIFMDAIHSICYIKDTKNEYISVNKAFYNLLNIQPSFNAKGKTDKDFFPENECLEQKLLDEKLLFAKEKDIYLEGFIPGSRKKKWGIIFKKGIFDTNGKIEGIITVITDITERRLSESGRILMERALNNSQTAVSIYNPSSPNSLHYVNDYFKKLFCLKEVPKNYDERNNAILKMVHPDDLHLFKGTTREYGLYKTIIFRLINSDNSITWIETNNINIETNSNSYIGTFSKDITQNRLSNELNIILKESIDDVKESLAVLSEKTKKMVFTGKYREKLYEIPNDVFNNMTNIEWVEKFLHPDDREINREYDKKSSWPRERIYRIITPTGETRWIEAMKVNKKFTYNGETCLAFFDRDISLRKSIEFQKDILNLALEELKENALLVFDPVKKQFIYSNCITEKHLGSLLDLNQNEALINFFNKIKKQNEEKKSFKTSIPSKDKKKLNVEIKYIERKIQNSNYIISILDFK